MRSRPEEELLDEDQTNNYFNNTVDNDDIKWGINGSFVSDRVERRLSQVEKVKQ